MTYPDSIEQKLGFDKIKEFLAKHCLSALGNEYVEELKFSNNYDKIDRETALTEEFLYIITQYDTFPQNNYSDIQKEIDKLKIEGYFLSEDELFNVLLFSRTIVRILNFFEATEPEEFPRLKSFFTDFHFDRRSAQKIERIIDNSGKLRNDASDELADIRRDMNSCGSRLRKKVNSILTSFKEKGFIGDDFHPTIRNGRMVLPIQSEYKRQIPGLVHDESITGQTTYLEPTSIFESNNELRELNLRESREIRRILRDISFELGTEIQSFVHAQNILGNIDFIRSKALLARALESVKPILSPKPKITLQQAYHPILKLTHEPGTIVPLDVHLNNEERILIISGPNAGGKSVCLKTIGLLQYMLQCGLLIPCDEHSEIGIFDQLFVDIGDDQSLENDLSTYSSHLKNMKNLLFYANKKTLFLIDEFGTGTDPVYGGAIAESILEKVNLSKAMGVVTTHYENLKHMADENEGLNNGAMLFDQVALKPLYSLSIGQPGSSFAIEIANKSGLDEDVIAASERRLGGSRVDYDAAIKALNEEKITYHNKLSSIVGREEMLKENIADYKELKEHLDDNKKEIIINAKREAKEIIKSANKTVENSIATIQREKADKAAIQRQREQLKKFEEKQEQDIQKISKTIKKQKDVNYTFKVGDLVSIKGQNSAGKIVSMDGNKAEIQFGGLTVRSAIKQLVPAGKQESNKEKSQRNSYSQTMINKAQETPLQIDIRGYRVQEAMFEVDNFIDNALMAGYSEIKILHGKGNGILKEAIRQHLKGYKQVNAIRDEHIDLGGSGITVINLD